MKAFSMWKWLQENWERTVFSAVGFVFLAFSFKHLWNSAIANASATFAMAIFCFIYSNLARFKRFKGLGFEAELWEDKQREAAALIDQLSGIISIYSHEIMMARVMMNRWGGGEGVWKSHWALFDRLNSEHRDFGQEIDLSELKTELDAVFLFDLVSRPYGELQRVISDGHQKALVIINKEHGSPITDIEGYNKRYSELTQVLTEFERTIDNARKSDIAGDILSWAEDSKKRLKSNFDIEIEFDSDAIKNLKIISKASQQRPIEISDQLLSVEDTS